MGKRISNRKSLLLSPCCESHNSGPSRPGIRRPFSRKAFRTVFAGYGAMPALFRYTAINIQKWQTVRGLRGIGSRKGGTWQEFSTA